LELVGVFDLVGHGCGVVMFGVGWNVFRWIVLFDKSGIGLVKCVGSELLSRDDGQWLFE
jgi:hypothetical protein